MVASGETRCRRAFDLALSRELASVIREAKERGQWIREASNLWEMEGWLAARRLHIDRSFDFRYSVLPIVFATLICPPPPELALPPRQARVDASRRMSGQMPPPGLVLTGWVFWFLTRDGGPSKANLHPAKRS